MGSGRGNGDGDGAASSTSSGSRRATPKSLAEDEPHQHRERLANESNYSPEPLEPPDKPALQRTESLSVELEGESRAASSCDVGPTSGEADASRAPEDIEDAREWPTKLPSTLELEHKHLNRRCRKNSPGRPREEPEDPGGEAVTSGGVQSHLERTRTMENERIINTNVLRRDSRLGGHMGELVTSRGVEGDWRR